MSIIGTHCLDCGEVKLAPAQINLMICDVEILSYYEFTCPRCRMSIRRPVDDGVLHLLALGGVVPTVWSVAGEVHPGHVISMADLTESPFDWDLFLVGLLNRSAS